MPAMVPNASSKHISLAVPPFLESSQPISNASRSASTLDIMFDALELDHIPDVGNVPSSAVHNTVCSFYLIHQPYPFGDLPDQCDHLKSNELVWAQQYMDLAMHHDFDEDEMGLPLAQDIQLPEGLLNTKEPFQFGKVPPQAQLFTPCLDFKDVPTWPESSWEEDLDKYFFVPGNEFINPSLDDLALEFGPRETDSSEWNDSQTSEADSLEQPECTIDDPEPQLDNEMVDVESEEPMAVISQSQDTPQFNVREGSPQDLTLSSPMVDGLPGDTTCSEDVSNEYITLLCPPPHAPLTGRHLPRAAKSRSLPARLLLAGSSRKPGFANNRTTHRESVKTASKRKWSLKTLPPKVNSERENKALKFSKENTVGVFSDSPYAVLQVYNPVSSEVDNARRPRTFWRCPHNNCTNVARTQTEAKLHVLMHSGVHIGCTGCLRGFLRVCQLKQHAKAYQVPPASQNSPCATQNPSWRDKDAWTEARILERATLLEVCGGALQPIRIKWI